MSITSTPRSSLVRRGAHRASLLASSPDVSASSNESPRSRSGKSSTSSKKQQKSLSTDLPTLTITKSSKDVIPGDNFFGREYGDENELLFAGSLPPSSPVLGAQFRPASEEEYWHIIEYDMTRPDLEFLNGLNAERERFNLSEISETAFEFVMDRFEKMYMEMTLPWAKSFQQEAQEQLDSAEDDSVCQVCGDRECTNSNQILFCDGCNISVHQECYGVPSVPESSWYCRRCAAYSPTAPCVLCPHTDGPMKRSDDSRWAHVACAIWIDEVVIGNATFMEPIERIEDIPKSRWKLPCYLCKTKLGACIQCVHRQCFRAFHVSCAMKAGLVLKISQRGDETVKKAYCNQHTPTGQTIDYQPQNAVPRPEDEDVSDSESNATAISVDSAGRVTYDPQNPVIPISLASIVAEQLASWSTRLELPSTSAWEAKSATMEIGKYWAKLRSLRKGAPLLRRLVVEPWTATASRSEQSDEEANERYLFLVRVRSDLERLRTLLDCVVNREKVKHKLMIVKKHLAQFVVRPKQQLFYTALRKLRRSDHRRVFCSPVTADIAPDYATIIKQPIDYSTIEGKVSTTYMYLGLPEAIQAFKNDVLLVFKNAKQYNAPGTFYHAEATRCQGHAKKKIFPALDLMTERWYDHLAVLTREMMGRLQQLGVMQEQENESGPEVDDSAGDSEAISINSTPEIINDSRRPSDAQDGSGEELTSDDGDLDPFWDRFGYTKAEQISDLVFGMHDLNAAFPIQTPTTASVISPLESSFLSADNLFSSMASSWPRGHRKRKYMEVHPVRNQKRRKLQAVLDNIPRFGPASVDLTESMPVSVQSSTDSLIVVENEKGKGVKMDGEKKENKANGEASAVPRRLSQRIALRSSTPPANKAPNWVPTPPPKIGTKDSKPVPADTSHWVPTRTTRNRVKFAESVGSTGSPSIHRQAPAATEADAATQESSRKYPRYPRKGEEWKSPTDAMFWGARRLRNQKYPGAPRTVPGAEDLGGEVALPAPAGRTRASEPTKKAPPETKKAKPPSTTKKTSSKPEQLKVPAVAELEGERAKWSNYELPEGLNIDSPVFAKMAKYPWYPAVVRDPRSLQVPSPVLQTRTASRQKVLVQFFDTAESHAWVPRERVVPVTGKKRVDGEYMIKTGTHVKAIQKGYEEAVALLGEGSKSAKSTIATLKTS